MKQVKAKYYPELDLVVPIETPRPSLVALDPDEPPPIPLMAKGEDEHGEWVLINFVSDNDTYFDYTVEAIKDESGNVLDNKVKQKKIGASEWDQM